MPDTDTGAVPKPTRRRPALLPCPFCGKRPSLFPRHPEIEGDGFGAVRCVNARCPVQPKLTAYSPHRDALSAHRAEARRVWNTSLTEARRAALEQAP